MKLSPTFILTLTTIFSLLITTGAQSQVLLERMVSKTAVFTPDSTLVFALFCFEFVTNGNQYCRLYREADQQIVAEFPVTPRAIQEAAQFLRESTINIQGMLLHEELGMCSQVFMYGGQDIPESDRFCLEN